MIPDSQVRPGVRLDYLDWIGQYAAKRRPDVIVHLGDFADMHSLSSYDRGKTSFEGRRYTADIDAACEGWERLNAPIDAEMKRSKWRPQRVILLGNHEDRITRAADDDSRVHGLISLDDLPYSASGWEVEPFLKPRFIDGVGYAHYWYRPNSGRPYSGAIETRLKNIGHTFTQGHEQTLGYAVMPTASGEMRQGLVAGACYLHDEGYKSWQGNDHWRGVIVKHEVRRGTYDPMFVSLGYLAREYGGKPLYRFRQRQQAA